VVPSGLTGSAIPLLHDDTTLAGRWLGGKALFCAVEMDTLRPRRGGAGSTLLVDFDDAKGCKAVSTLSLLEPDAEPALADTGEVTCLAGAECCSVAVLVVDEDTNSKETAGLALAGFASSFSYVPISGSRRIGFGAVFASGTFTSAGLAAGALASKDFASGTFVAEGFETDALISPEDFA